MSTAGRCADLWKSDLVLDAPAIATAVLAAFRHARVGVAVVDSDGRIVDGNAAFAAAAQMHLADLRGREIAEVAERASLTLERSPVDGSPPFELAVTVDHPVSEERALRQFVSTAPAAMAMFDRDMRYLEASARWMEDYRLAGSPDGLRGLRHYDVFPELPEALRAAHRSALAGETIAARDTRFERADGSVMWVRWEARPWHDARGAVAGIVLFTEDTTARVRAEEAVAQRERDLINLADAVPDVIIRHDADLRITFVNGAVERFMGLTPEALLGRTPREVGLPADLVELWEAAVAEVRRTGEARFHEFDTQGQAPSVLGDGPMTPTVHLTPTAPRSVAVRVVPERAPDGQLSGVIILARDQSQEAAANAALRDASRQKDEFLAVLAHELRNPLAPIRTGLEILNRAESQPAQSKRAREIMTRQLGHLMRLVDELLDLSRIGRGLFKLDKRPVRLVTALEHGLEASRAAVDAAGHVLALRLCPEALWIDGDLTRLAQVVSNLVNNAAKFTPRGGRIDVALRRDGDAGVIEVTDSGIGLSPDALPGLFQMFGQGAEGPSHGGLGIGLALARGLVELHGGRISASSKGKGQGSTFTVTFPLSSAAGEARRSEPDRASPAASRVLQVLVVDDNEDGADSVASLFEMAGHRVRVAYDGASGIALATERPPDVVFCDIGMPDMTGYQVAARLRADARLSGTLLVALTGWGTEADRQRSRDAGFDLHLTKPVDALALEHALWSRASGAPPEKPG